MSKIIGIDLWYYQQLRGCYGGRRARCYRKL